MGYCDADTRVYVDVLDPLYVAPGPIVVASTYLQCRIHRLRVCPSIQLGPPVRPICYALGMPWCTTKPPRVRELVGVFGCCCCCVNWCATSLVWGSLRVAVAIQHIAQHATWYCTVQHPCSLQQSATISNIYLALCQHHLGDTCI